MEGRRRKEVAGGDEDEWKRKKRGEIRGRNERRGLRIDGHGEVRGRGGSYIKILKMYECIGNEAT